MKTSTKLLLLLVVAGCSSPSARLGVASSKIIKGDPANGQWPAAGALVYHAGGLFEQFCSGTLLSPQWVVSAGHCSDTNELGFGATDIMFFVGDDATVESSGNAYQADVLQVNPGWNSQTVVNDISLVHLQAAVPSSVASPLPYNLASIGGGQAITMIGYGVNVADGTGSGTGNGHKRYADGTISSVYATTYTVPQNSQGQLTCFGDSGGPDLATLSGQLVVVGVHSTVDSDLCNGSGESTRVDAYASWINSVIGLQYPNGHACSGVSDCASLFCVDGLCCDAACDGDCNSCATGTCVALDGKTRTGADCDDGNPCTVGDACVHGACQGAPKDCGAGYCDLGTGDCVGGTCTADADCTAPTTCHSAAGASCSGGLCSYPIATDGTACSDGNPCTTAAACSSGTCVASASRSCATPPDACHGAGQCNAKTGSCGYPTLPDATACTLLTNACALSAACQGGTCKATTLKGCPAPDACHGPGQCDPSNGVCGGYPVLGDSTQCDDHNACTDNDHCVSGVCTGTPKASACGADQCHDAGQCDPATGTCSGVNKPNGTQCDDGDPSTEDDQCTDGLCKGTPKGVDPCFGKPDGTACSYQSISNGACSGGACTAVVPTNPCAGQADGNPCDDHDPCTRSDMCLDGVCTGTNPMICANPDSCQQAGACDPATGECVYPSQPDGTACDDGDPGTSGDHCSAGRCVGEAKSGSDGGGTSACDGGACLAAESKGCGCASADASPLSALALLSLLALARRARSRG